MRRLLSRSHFLIFPKKRVLALLIHTILIVSVLRGVSKAITFSQATTISKVKTLRDYTQPLSTYIVQYLFALRNPPYISLAAAMQVYNTAECFTG